MIDVCACTFSSCIIYFLSLVVDYSLECHVNHIFPHQNADIFNRGFHLFIKSKMPSTADRAWKAHIPVPKGIHASLFRGS